MATYVPLMERRRQQNENENDKGAGGTPLFLGMFVQAMRISQIYGLFYSKKKKIKVGRCSVGETRPKYCIQTVLTAVVWPAGK